MSGCRQVLDQEDSVPRSSKLSAPAASNRVKNLEEQLGFKLLYRTSQGVTLTPAGEAFVHHARLVLERVEHLAGDMQEYGEGIKGHVRIWANTTAISEFMPAVLSHFLRDHPDVNIDLREVLSGDQAKTRVAAIAVRNPEQLRRLETALIEAGVPVVTTRSADRNLWQKLLQIGVVVLIETAEQPDIPGAFVFESLEESSIDQVLRALNRSNP